MLIAMVAGEASGDLLGAALMKALRIRHPQAKFIGIGGPQMIAEGFESFYDMQKLSIMGLVEVLKHLPELLKLRHDLFETLSDRKPAVFIGIDAPDFNLALEKKLKQRHIKTVHYVSPSVWAWRQWRVKKIGRSVDLMLTLFPFEAEFYQQHNIPVRFIGHPLADIIPMHNSKSEARQKLSIPTDQLVIALLPGSRLSEVEKLTAEFLKSTIILKKHYPNIEFICPLVNAKTREAFEKISNDLGVTINAIEGKSRTAMQASDAILLASGTATLEALLIKRPMVICYKLSAFTYWILKTFKIMKVKNYSLPNLLAGRKIVPELIQEQANSERIVSELTGILNKPSHQQALSDTYAQIHQSLKKNASEQAAIAVEQLIAE